MLSAAVSSETWDNSSSPISEIDVLWITAGLGCDGDTIAMTAATQPSIEDILLGAIPWIPKVRLHNPFLAFEVGEDFMKYFHHAAAGKLRLFILVGEGSIPNELNKKEGYWASFGTDQTTGQPITTCEWIDRLAPKAWAVIAAGTCHLRWDPCHGGQPYRVHARDPCPVVGTRKEVIGQIHVSDTHLCRQISPKKLSDSLDRSSVLQAELRPAGGQSMPYGVLDLYHGEYVEIRLTERC
jgi:NADH ubiquinone oxidoreductase subunit